MLYKNRLYVPNTSKIKLLILNEVHKSPYSGHLRYQKMITMLRKEYFWPNMKNRVVEYIDRCIEFQQVKVEHQHPLRYFTTITNSKLQMGSHQS